MLTEDEAKMEAERELRFKIGNLPFLGDIEKTDEFYEFPVLYSKIDLPDKNEDRDVEYFEKVQVGYIRVDKDTGNIERTSTDELNDRVHQVKELARIGILNKRDF